MSQLEGVPNTSTNPNSLEDQLKKHDLGDFISNFTSIGCKLDDLIELRDNEIDEFCKDIKLPLIKKIKLRKLIKKIKNENKNKNTF